MWSVKIKLSVLKNPLGDKLDSFFLFGWTEISEQWHYSKKQKVKVSRVFLKWISFEFPSFLISLDFFVFFEIIREFLLKGNFLLKHSFDHIQFCFLINSLIVAQILRLSHWFHQELFLFIVLIH